MKSLKKTTLASLVGAAALAAAGAANATIVVGGENGYEFSVDGNINQFYVYTDDKANDVKSSEMRDGLLPAFLGFNISAPEMNGLKIGARVSISPSTNGTSQAGTAMEQREAFATVDGSFGQILFGKALGLYGSHNILTEQTLYGVGWGTGNNLPTTANTTTLGGIGLGYDYADWRSQIKWTSADMNGFKVAVAIVDPQGPGVILGPGATGPLQVLSSGDTNEDPRWEADLSYAGAFDGGSFSAWASGAWQDRGDSTLGANADDAEYWTVGGTLAVGGFEFMAQYSDAKDVVTDLTGLYGGGNVNADWDQYVVQAGYRFAGTTLVSANYSELQTDVEGYSESDDTADRVTVGIYHDVNANLKLVAEYTQIEHDNKDRLESDIFSVGGFVTW